MKLQEPVIPLSNVEKQLATLAGEYSGELDAPKSTVEAYLANLLGTYNGDLPSPVSKIEKYLGSMVGVYESDIFPRPIYSTELYFASYAGLWDGDLPQVSNRVEYFLKKVIENTGKLIDRSGSGRVITFVDTGISRPFVNLDIYGRSTQETTTGKNLFDAKNLLKNASNDLYSWNLTVDGDKISVDYTVKVNASADNKIYTSSDIRITDDALQKIKKSIYLIYEYDSENFSDDAIFSVALRMTDNKNIYMTTLTKTIKRNVVKFNDFVMSYGYTSDDIAFMFLRVLVIERRNSTITMGTYHSEVRGLRLYTANSDTETKPWEPYTGGIPAPNPDYPMPIKSVGYDPGVNLYPEVPFTSSHNNYVTMSGDSTGKITVSGSQSITGGRDIIKTPTFILEPGTYTVSYIGTVPIPIVLVDELNNTALANSNNGSDTFNIAETISVHFGVDFTTSYLNVNYDFSFYIMLNEGSVSYPYKSYDGGKKQDVEVRVSGKNLFDISNPIAQGQGISVNNGIISFDDIPHSYLTISWVIETKNVDYITAQCIISDDNANNLHLNIDGIIGDGVEKTNILPNSIDDIHPQSVSVSVKNFSYIRVNARNRTKIKHGSINNIQLELGTTATPYEPYKTPQLLTVKAPEGGFLGSPIPRGYGYSYIDVDGVAYKADVASLKSGMYKSQNFLHIWDGTENISHRTADPNYPDLICFIWYGYSSVGYSGMPVMCDIFKYVNDSTVRECWTIARSSHTNYLYFWVDRSIDTPEKFHALMMGHQILYVRNAPVNLAIPNFGFLDIASEFEDLVSYKDSTVITNDEDAFMAATIKVKEKSIYKMRGKAVRYE